MSVFYYIHRERCMRGEIIFRPYELGQVARHDSYDSEPGSSLSLHENRRHRRDFQGPKNGS
ncbi:hypothetical protein EJB05_55306 [Eragrostis curvula]|uniref:Uncharacterized protein n=1 Tax=Eragrostis curvula TaxID=38414 RepID=A0A5J9SK07_9POAL|nr:hypothetical protein EJB05_55306 [Eragrostis curvula]